MKRSPQKVQEELSGESLIAIATLLGCTHGFWLSCIGLCGDSWFGSGFRGLRLGDRSDRCHVCPKLSYIDFFKLRGFSSL